MSVYADRLALLCPQEAPAVNSLAVVGAGPEDSSAEGNHWADWDTVAYKTPSLANSSFYYLNIVYPIDSSFSISTS